MGDLPLRTPTHRRLGGPLPRRLANAPHAHPPPESLPLIPGRCLPRMLRGIRPDFSGLSPCGGQVAYVLLTRAPVAGRRKQAFAPAAPRLACVKPVASVHPEPGSNSSLLFILFFFFFFKKSSKTSVSVVTVVHLACVGLADTFWPDCRFIVAGRNLTEFLESVAAPRRTRSDSVSCTTSSLL